MSFKISELREVPDEVLIELHDKQAQHTMVGTDYYLEELRRRDQLRSMESSHKLAVASLWLAAANTVVAVVAVVIAVAA